MSEVSWTRERIGALLKVRYGKALPKDQRDDSAPFPVLGSAGRMTGTAEPLAFDPVIVIGRKGNVGQVQLETAGCWPIDTTYYAAIPQRLDARFLTWQLRSLALGKLDSSTATPSLRRQDLEAQEVLVPPLEEQRQIVAILEDHLSSLDAADACLAAAEHRTETLRSVVLAQLHAGPTVPLTGLTVSAGYGTSAKCIADGPGPAVVRIPNLIDGAIDLSDEKRVADSSLDVSKSTLSEGDLLIVRTNGSVDLIGRCAVVGEEVRAAFASYLIRYRLRQDIVRPAWVQAMLTTPQLRSQIESLAASSAGQHNLSLGKLGPLPIPTPSISEQDRLLDKIRSLDEERKRLMAALVRARSRATALRRSLLAAAFSGRLTGSSPEMSAVEGRIEA
ncbi:MAG TPA: restriction endonuclease subunit S [Arachnia sp.]|nr:restriction endonuclease subunit S [Arachnia sp.]